MENEITETKSINRNNGLIAKFGDKYNVDPEKVMTTLKSTAFKQKEGVEISHEQMMALLIVADQYKLNPFTREIYAFPDKNGGIVPVVGIDGWLRIINEHPEFDGIEFISSDETTTIKNGKECPVSITCIIYRKDRSHPTSITEYLDECYREIFKDGPWQTHTKRLLRHKATIQCARYAISLAGIFDEDEANRIIDGITIEGETVSHESKETKALNETILNGNVTKGDVTKDDKQYHFADDVGDAIKSHLDKDAPKTVTNDSEKTKAPRKTNKKDLITAIKKAKIDELLGLGALSLDLSKKEQFDCNFEIERRKSELRINKDEKSNNTNPY